MAEGNTKVLYSLYGVVEHSGTMRSGHYTAYVKMRAMNNHLSDLVLRGQSQGKSLEIFYKLFLRESQNGLGWNGP